MHQRNARRRPGDALEPVAHIGPAERAAIEAKLPAHLAETIPDGIEDLIVLDVDELKRQPGNEALELDVLVEKRPVPLFQRVVRLTGADNRREHEGAVPRPNRLRSDRHGN